MKNLSERILEDETVKALLKDVSDEEMEELMAWFESIVQPIQNVSLAMKDLVSTEDSAERLCDAINGFAKEGGLVDV